MTKRNQREQVARVQKEKFARIDFPSLTPMNEAQQQFLDAMKFSKIVVGAGSAGTGKTLLACWHAAKKLHNKEIRKIVLIRAYSPLAGRTIGFMPGDAKEKLMPFYRQMVDYIEDYYGKARTDISLKNDEIEICSLETIRGRSWDKTIIIVDESQSLFVPEIQALVTRLGEGSQMIFCGDNSGLQSDVKNGMDGLSYLDKIVERYDIPDVEVVYFNRDDIVRSGITKSFVIAFEEELYEEFDAEDGDPIVTQQEINRQFKTGR